jgi:hypothetical protein
MPEANLFLDKRAHPRVPVKIPVNYRVMEDNKEISNIRQLGERTKSAQTLDTSLGGMFVVAEQMLDMGAILSLKISIPGKTSALPAFAEVVWSNATGAGLHFLAMKEDDAQALDAYLQSLSPG